MIFCFKDSVANVILKVLRSIFSFLIIWYSRSRGVFLNRIHFRKNFVIVKVVIIQIFDIPCSEIAEFARKYEDFFSSTMSFLVFILSLVLSLVLSLMYPRSVTSNLLPTSWTMNRSRLSWSTEAFRCIWSEGGAPTQFCEKGWSRVTSLKMFCLW